MRASLQGMEINKAIRNMMEYKSASYDQSGIALWILITTSVRMLINVTDNKWCLKMVEHLNIGIGMDLVRNPQKRL